MKIEMRHIVAAVLLVFAWKGHSIEVPWPEVGKVVSAVEPSPDQKAWAADVRAITPKMLPADREYLANLYDAMREIIGRDTNRETPIIGSTEAFARYHAGTLEAAIELEKVGRYPGLDVAIDKVFFSALKTDDPRALTPADRQAILDACSVLVYTFKVGTDG